MKKEESKERWDERRAYDEAHAKQVSNAKDYTRLEKENCILRDRLSKFDDIKRRVNNMPYDEFLELLKHYNKWADDIKERAKYEPTEASCDFHRLKSSMAQFITRDEYFGSYKKKGQGE
jgi:hypothetical protein